MTSKGSILSTKQLGDWRQNLKSQQPIQQFLVRYRHLWDHAQTPPHVRREFRKVTQCGTGELGHAEFVTEHHDERLKVDFTCKSKLCPRCGRKTTLDWLRKIEYELPGCKYTSVLFTTRNIMWPIFRENRGLLSILPEIAARTLQEWALTKFQAEVVVMAVLHTFGGDLGFKPHLHVLVSRVGLDLTRTRLIKNIAFPVDAIGSRWTHNVINSLRDIHANEPLQCSFSNQEMSDLLDYEFDAWWKSGVRNLSSPSPHVAYIGRYLRRTPIANRNIISIDNNEIRFYGKDTRRSERREMTIPAGRFLELLANHLSIPYANSVRYFGLLSPVSKSRSYQVFMGLLGQAVPKHVSKLTWRGGIIREFHRDPLISADGKPMRWNLNVIPSRENS
jgi:hypothetical protein